MVAPHPSGQLGKAEDASPLVSVIIPVYGVEAYLDECVASVVGQTYESLEIILVDDGSPDACPRMCDAWAGRDARVTVLHLENGGLSGARNAGLSCAKGEFVLFVDSDDWVDSRLVETAIRELVASGADVAMYRFSKTRGDGTPLPGNPLSDFPPAGAFVAADDALRHLLLGHVENYAWSFVSRRSLYEGDVPIRFPVGELMEDLSTTYRVLGRSEGVVYVDEPLYFYRMRSGSSLQCPTIGLADDIYRSSMRRADDLKREHSTLGLETHVGLVRSLLLGLLTLDVLRPSLPPDEYAARRKRCLEALRQVPPFEVLPFLTARDALLLVAVDIRLDVPMRSAISLMRKLRSASGGRGGNTE